MANDKKLSGTIIQRKDGTFTVRIQDGVKSNGKPYRKEKRAKNLEEAELKLKELRKEIKEEKRRKTLGFKDYTTEEYINLFLEYKKRYIKSTSYERIVSTVKTHIIPYVGMVRFYQLKGEQIQKLLDMMYENKLSHSSIKKVYDFF